VVQLAQTLPQTKLQTLLQMAAQQQQLLLSLHVLLYALHAVLLLSHLLVSLAVKGCRC
jgi:hypothetical protein